MVTLKALEAAISQIDSIRAHELSFEAGGFPITLRPLRSDEETQVQRYSQAAWEGADSEGDPAAYQDFMDRVRLSTLGYSIIQIGELDLRDVEYLDTGEFDENNNAIAMMKHDGVIDLIQKQWTKALCLQVFAKFGELLERVEVAASKLVKFTPTDLDEEIGRLERRLKTLSEQRDARENVETKSFVQKQQSAVIQATEEQARVRQEVLENAAGTLEETEQPDEAPQPPRQAPQPPRQAAPPSQPSEPPRQPTAPPQTPQTPQRRQSSLPQEAAPPERHTSPETLEEASPQETQAFDEQGIVLPHDGDSFFDPSDPEAAMAAEAERQAQLHAANIRRQREKKMAQQRAEAIGVPTSADMARERLRSQQDAGHPNANRLDPRTAGLREAANLQDQVFDTGAGRQQTGRPQRAQPQQAPGQPGAPATLHGKPVYKMPTQTLDKSRKQQAEESAHARQHGEPAPSPVQVNPAGGGRQDKFRGPQDR